MKMADVSLKQAYEWVKTGHWGILNFTQWLNTKGVNSNAPLYTPDGTLIHRANGPLAYEWIKTNRWSFKMFQQWLISFL